VTGTQVNLAKLGKVPSAKGRRHGGNATNAANATNAGHATTADTANRWRL
jgi:hypothetical protein